MAGLLATIQRALETQASWSGGTGPLLNEVFAAVSARLRRDGTLEFEVQGDGALESSESLLPPTGDKRCLGTTLARSGVGRLVFHSGLKPSELASFFAAVAVYGSRVSAGDHDLVTYWFEYGSPTIQLCDLELHVEGPLNDMVEVDLLDLVSGAEISTRAPVKNALHELMDEPSPATLRSPDPLVDTQEIHDWAREVEVDVEERLQRQVVNSLLASLSARTPALSGNEIALLLRRVMSDLVASHHFEHVMGTIRHVEAFTLEDAYVSRSTRDRARAVLRKLRSPRLLERLIQCFAGHRKPGTATTPLLDWLVQESPLTMWSAVLPRLDPKLVGYGAIAFSLVMDFDESFWTEAIRVLTPERRKIVRRALTQLSDTMFDVSDGPRPVPVDTSPVGMPGVIRQDTSNGVYAVKQDDDGWEDFQNLDWLEDSEAEALDESIIEFLRERTRAGKRGED